MAGDAAFSVEKWAYKNGLFVKGKKRYIDPASHALSYSSAIIGGINFSKKDENTVISFRLEEHFARLLHHTQQHQVEEIETRFYGAKKPDYEHINKIYDMAADFRDTGAEFPIKINVRYGNTHETYSLTLNELMSASEKVVQANNGRFVYMRPIIFRSAVDAKGSKGRIGVGSQENLWEVVLLPIKWPSSYLGKDALEHGARLVCSPAFCTPPAESSFRWLKSADNYKLSSMVKDAATAHGFTDALLTDGTKDRNVQEASAANIFVIKDGIIYTPPLGPGILPGITRDTVIKLARMLGYEVKEVDIPLKEALGADEIFLTGTAVKVNPVCSITVISETGESNEHKIGNGKPGAVTSHMRSAYTAVSRGDEFEDLKYPKNCLTRIDLTTVDHKRFPKILRQINQERMKTRASR